MKALQAAGATVEVISLRRPHPRREPARARQPRSGGQDGHGSQPGRLRRAAPSGGFINPDLLRQSAEAREFVSAQDREDKPIASLCHGPWVLASAGLLQGRTLTSWPGVRDDLVNAGATWLDQEFVRDGNLATSRGPQDLNPLVQGCLDLFAQRAPMSQQQQPLASHSAPQANEPPQIVLRAMKWLPKPSLRTAIALGAVAAWFIATKRHRGHGGLRRLGRAAAG